MRRALTAGSTIARAAVLLPAAMAAWWFLAKGPSLWLLEKLAYLPLGLLVAPAGLPPIQVAPVTGDWTFNVAVNTYGRNPQTNEALFVSSLEFTADQDSVALFACGWFAYLALAAAANAYTRAQAATVAKGLAIVTAMNVLSLAAFAYINGYGSVINGPGGGGYLWLLKYVYHLIYLVAPFAGPFGVALLLHPRWRAGFGFLAEGRAPAGRAQRVTAGA
ncbi:MAG: hypothetical protein JSU00_05650 [Acidobacteria bacterium]|nr:hypothetical protein [Acidobacteriota bacterium]